MFVLLEYKFRLERKKFKHTSFAVHKSVHIFHVLENKRRISFELSEAFPLFYNISDRPLFSILPWIEVLNIELSVYLQYSATVDKHIQNISEVKVSVTRTYGLSPSNTNKRQ
jgi:hypothetical protein